MQIDLKLNMAQKQRLILTQIMQQSINILQMSAYELKEYIDKQFEENPVLEGELEYIENKENINKSKIEKLQEDYYSETYSYQYNNEDDVSVFNFIAEDKSLKDYLYEQLYEVNSSITIKKIVYYLIESLDNRGYLENTIEGICCELIVEEEQVKKALDILQSLEPCGIGARNLQECLIIQLKRRGVLDEIIEEIIMNYLEKIADNQYGYISKQLKISPKEVQAYGDTIKGLEPKPSRGYYTGEKIKFIIPDAYILKLDNEYTVIMNNSIIPQLTINDIYRRSIEHGNNDVDEYVKEKVNIAKNLIKDIDQRNNTILKLLECIVRKQRDYFEKGKKFLKPMVLKDIANEIGIHESTVSRAIKDKYILTSRGTVKIKDLFCNGIMAKGVEGGDISTNTVKNKIKKIIELENKNKPLSDQAISTLLNEEEIDISRRTVAKYREELGIKASAKRKRI